MSNIEQTLRSQGCTEEQIAQAKVIIKNPDAYAYAMRTLDFAGAYEMCKPKEESQIDLNEWFGLFVEAHPEDAKSLSIGLTKFARFVQSSVDKKKASQ
jgi:hypothetical protein